jgi:hypothetical protein
MFFLFFSNMKTYVPTLVIIVTFLIVGFSLVRSDNKIHPRRALLPLATEEYEGAEDGALEYAAYEFNLLKDPATGTIPKGTYAEEWRQALATEKHYDQPVNPLAKTDLFASWSFKGPSNLGGRTRAIGIDVNNNSIILAGCISGGISRTTNGGASWSNVTPLGHVKNISSIAQDTRSGWTNTWYFCTGETLGNSASDNGAFYVGTGVFKSTNNGASWRRLSNSDTGSEEFYDDQRDVSSRIAVDPTNGNVYLAATNGIWRSTDTGATWANVLGQNGGSWNSGWTTDIVITTGGVLYAAFSGFGGSSLDGVWTSTTGASASWTRIANSSSVTGWNTSGNYGRVVLALAPSDQTKLFALYWNNTTSSCSNSPAPEAELFKYNSSTSTWTDLSANLPDETGCLEGNDPFAVQTGYDLCIAVKPDDVNTVFIGGTNVYRSTSGFTNTTATTRIGGYGGPSTYASYANHHPDIQELKFASGSNDVLYTGDDGGIQKADITVTTPAWTSLNNSYPSYQYYHVALDPNSATNAYFLGGAQDNGSTYMTTSTTANLYLGGDGCSVGMNSGGAVFYLSTQLGTAYRDNAGFVRIDPNTNKSLFVTNFWLDPDNTNFLYYANGDTLYRTGSASSVTQTSGWTALTGLASAVGSTRKIFGITTSRGTYSTNTSIQATLSRLYVGTNNGQLFRLDDPQNVSASAAPANITPTSMTGGGTLVDIAVDPSDSRKIMAVYSNYGVNSVWYTADASQASPTWSNLEGNSSALTFRSVVKLNDGVISSYVVGTSKGIYSTNVLSGNLTTWLQEAPGSIGYLPVPDIAYRRSDQTMLAGTHGNGMFLAMSVALPVGFIAFDARPASNEEVALNWSVVNAQKIAKYIIQRSADGVHWDNGATVTSNSNGEAAPYFSIDRPGNVTQALFYRIRAVEQSGNAYYSAVVRVALESGTNSRASIYPTVVSQYVTLDAENVGQFATLSDMQGHRLISVQLASGKNTADLSHLPPGHYIISVYHKGHLLRSARIMKQ